MRWLASFAALLILLGPAPLLAQDEAGRCPGGKSKNAAMWLSIAHPGVGEWFLNGWGSFEENAPKRKFWLGFIPFYGWPGYLQVRSAIDARNCRTDDRI